MSTIIIIQILFSKQLSRLESYIILLEIFLLSIILSGSFLFLFPGPYGNDSSYHVEFIKSILLSGNLENYVGQYQNYPIFHLLFVSIILITNLGLKTAQFVIGIIQILFSIFIFILTKRIFNTKASLISTLFISLSTYSLQPKYSYYPSSFATIFFILIIYFFFHASKTILSSLLQVSIFATMIFTHPLAPAITIMFFLLIFIISSFIESKEKKVSIWTIIFMSVFTLSRWMKPIGFNRDLFSTIILSIRTAFETLDFTAVERVTLASHYNWFDVVLCDLGFTILLFLGIGGAFWVLNPFQPVLRNKEKSVILSALTLFFIPVPYLLTLIYPQSLPNRWFPFIEIFASMFVGVSVLLTFQKISEYGMKFTVVMILFITVFFMTTTPKVNPNAQLYATELSYRSALKESEIKAADFINSLHLQQIHANTKYIYFINRSFLDHHNWIRPDDPATYRSGVVIIRNYDLEKGFTIPFYGAKGKLLEIIYPDEYFYKSLNSSSKFYENGKVRIYYNP